MKAAILLILLISCTRLLSGEQFRPFLEFYKKGQEAGRMVEYAKVKDGQDSMLYKKAFHGKEFEGMNVFKVNYISTHGGEIVIENVVSDEVIQRVEDVRSMAAFFSMAFPEDVRQLFEPREITGFLYCFHKSDAAVLVPYEINRPEFSLVKVDYKNEKPRKLIVLQKGAMSANKPPELFMSHWDKKNNSGK